MKSSVTPAIARLLVPFCLVTASLVATPWTPTAARAATVSIAVSPAKPMKGESFTVTAALPTAVARPVQLQRKVSSHWRTIARATTSAAGVAAFTTSTRKAVRIRIVAPTTTIGAVRYPRLATSSRTVKVAGQSIRLALPASAFVGTSAAMTATLSPVRAGRPVAFQVLRVKTWTTVVTVTANGSGVAAATLPSQAAGRYSIRVVAPSWRGAGSVTSGARTITFVAPPVTAPTVAKVSPPSGSTAGGTTVTLTGTGFTGTSSVTFGGTAGKSPKVVSATQISVVTPVHAAGQVDVRVVTNHGSSAVGAAAKFTFVAPVGPPSIAALSPRSGGLQGGTTVTITGSNLGGTKSVTFGGKAGTGLFVVSASQVRVTAPARTSTGDVDVVVTTAAGQATKAAAYSYVALNGTLDPGQSLSRGSTLRSPSGNYRLVMQNDGNLVIYNSGGSATWATGTSQGTRAAMQSDGNFVVYADSGSAVWSSTTDGFGGASLVMQDDGNLVIYLSGRALWSKDGVLYDQLDSGQTLTAGQSRLSPNHQYALIMQGDGNLVLYRSGGTAVWASNTQGSGNWTAMQGDGNLVVYTASGQALWASNTAGRSGSSLRVQNDAKLVIYQGGAAVWDSSGPDAPFNAGIIASANGFADGSYGGQCLLFVENRIRAAGGPSIAMGNDTTTYQSQWPRWATEVQWAQVIPGDIVQFQSGSSVHTLIITSGNTPSTAQVVDSNYGWNELVHRGSFASRASGFPAGSYKIWRVHR